MRVVLHIGMYKTATTSLQRNLLVRHPQVINLGKPYRMPEQQKAVNAMIHSDRIAQNSDAFRSAMSWALPPEDIQDKTAVFSEEDLTHYNVTDRLTVAERLYDLFGPARIMLTIRNQPALAQSMYLYQMRTQPRAVSFDGWLDDQSKFRHGNFFDSLHFDRLAAAYAKIFGRENVGVFSFEKLVSDPDAYARALCGWMGIDAEMGAELMRATEQNVRPTSRELAYQRLRQKFLPNVALSRYYPRSIKALFDRFLAGSGQVDAAMGSAWRERFDRLYAEGNRDLAATYDLQLAEDGYPV